MAVSASFDLTCPLDAVRRDTLLDSTTASAPSTCRHLARRNLLRSTGAHGREKAAGAPSIREEKRRRSTPRERAKRREREKLEKMRAELQVQEAKEQMKALGKDVGDEIINMKEEERQKLIKDQRDKQRKAEQNEAKKMLEQSKRLDYITRALRLEELPVLEARYAKRLEEDRARHDAQYVSVEKGKSIMPRRCSKEAFGSRSSHREKWEAGVLARGRLQYAKDRAAAEEAFKQEAIARKVARETEDYLALGAREGRGRVRVEMPSIAAAATALRLTCRLSRSVPSAAPGPGGGGESGRNSKLNAAQPRRHSVREV